MGEIVRIELPTPFRIGSVNAFLLEGSPLTLVDTGPRWPDALGALEAALVARGVLVSDIELVLLTHQHCDHIGLAGVVRERSGAQVAAVSTLATYLADYERAVAAEDEFAVEVMRRYGTDERRIAAIRDLSASFWRYAEAVDVDRVLTVGDVVDAGGRRLEVMARPGHSPTDTVFVDRAAGVGLTGDHLLPRVSSNPVIHRGASSSVETRDRTLPIYLDSLKYTRELDLAEILPGHGDPTTRPGELIDSRLGMHERRKEQIASLIAQGNTTVAALANILWGTVDVSQIYLAVSEVLGHTDILIEEQRITEQTGGDCVVFVPEGNA